MPSSNSVGPEGNPYLNLGGMGEALDILTRRLSSEEIRGRIMAGFSDATYTAETDRNTSGAILLITATSSNPDESVAVMRAVMAQAPVSLTGMQEALNVPEESRISTMTLLADSRAVPEAKARTQLLLVSGAGGVGLTLVASVLLDGLLRARRERAGTGTSGTSKRRRRSIGNAADAGHPGSDRVPALAGSAATSSMKEGSARTRTARIMSRSTPQVSLSNEVTPPVPLTQRPS
ncbi:hypothetical protein AB0N65_02685 [Paenarthrobacter sp. NPDC089322]|uniref:hypothetical protein n=1 Tax=Paenarthrobacter sp. NPDC089322 TaxID=3155065 RepID=UPI00344960FE